jgi:hypothetical protein
VDQSGTAEGQDHRLGEAANFTKSIGLLPAVLCVSTEESLEMKFHGVDVIKPAKLDCPVIVKIVVLPRRQKAKYSVLIINVPNY